MLNGTICNESDIWDEIVHDLGGHPLQLWGWGEVKAKHHWRAHRILFTDEKEQVIGAAQILERSLPKPFRRLCYVPRGPISIEGQEIPVLEALASYTKKHLPGTVLSIEPDWTTMPVVQGWRRSTNTILIPHTLILDLTKSEDDLLANMRKKTRYEVRRSERSGISLRRVSDADRLDDILKIYRETAARAKFAIHDDAYYRDIHEKLGDSSLIFAAYEGSKLIAFVWLAASKKTAFELYGGMDERGRVLWANYALKWYAIRKCKEWGIERYDMNGLLNDGISTFKRGFARHENTLAGTYDYPLGPLYGTWTKALPTAKKIIRAIKR